ncbi:MAG: hypothetical protein NTW21_43260 [Verrucomicrobia bacterium]|nr:hypothetical protein [Verrucomicrobiota bacterium]
MTMQLFFTTALAAWLSCNLAAGAADELRVTLKGGGISGTFPVTPTETSCGRLNWDGVPDKNGDMSGGQCEITVQLVDKSVVLKEHTLASDKGIRSDIIAKTLVPTDKVPWTGKISQTTVTVYGNDVPPIVSEHVDASLLKLASIITKEFNPSTGDMTLAIPTFHDEQGKRFTMIWRETSVIPIEKVPSPDGFKVTPVEAVKPIMARSTRAPWAEFYLFVDSTSYYFGNTRKGEELTAPQPGHYVIDGITGKIAEPKPDGGGKPAP